jgi:Bifunctional DNA primase/polymerase, N-terminal/Family of unknown function (DUF5906)
MEDYTHETTLKSYYAAGYSVVPIPVGHKSPYFRDKDRKGAWYDNYGPGWLGTGWQHLRITAAHLAPNAINDRSPEFEAAQRFKDGPCNIGIIWGKASNDHGEIDVDALEAAGLADVIAPATGFIYGRAGKPRSHRVYKFEPREGGYPTVQFRDADGHMIIELRGDGAQTVVPPSVHESGEPVIWEHGGDGEPATVKYEVLLAACQKIALEVRKLRGQPETDHSGKCDYSHNGGVPYSTPVPCNTRYKDMLKSALGKIPANCCEPDWYRVALGLANLVTFNPDWRDYAWTLYRDWSMTSPEQYDEGQCLAKFDHAINCRLPANKRPVTYRSILKMAGGYGWTDEGPAAPENDVSDPESALSAVLRMNERYFAIGNYGGRCVIAYFKNTETGVILDWQKHTDFCLQYCNQYVSFPNPNKPGDVIRKPLGKYWFDHPRRRTYDGVELDPEGSKVLPGNILNLWQGYGVEPIKGDWHLTREHIRTILANSNTEYDNYIMNLFAWTIQNPGKHAEVMLAIRGNKGSGKGLIFRALCAMFGSHGLPIYQQEQLTGKFSGHTHMTLFIYSNEAYWAEAAESTLKAIVTENTRLIEPKQLTPFKIRNRLTIMADGNDEHLVPATGDERRFPVFEVDNKYAQGACSLEERKAYFDPIYQELYIDAEVNKPGPGLSAMLYDLLHWPLPEGWHPRYNIPQTEALADQKELGLSPLQLWWRDLLDGGVLPGAEFNRPNRTTLDDLMESAMPYSGTGYNTITRPGMLKHLQGESVRQVRVGKAGARIWEFDSLGSLRVEWRRTGNPTPWSPKDEDIEWLPPEMVKQPVPNPAGVVDHLLAKGQFNPDRGVWS